MIIDLPQPIQQQVLYYLEADNFKAAKELHDKYLPLISSNENESDEKQPN